MIFDAKSAETLAGLLLQINAVSLRPNDPFTWASGLRSPIYCDNRVTLSHPRVRTYLREQMAHVIKAQHPSVDVIAGVATGAIALAALVAQELDLPMVYVRASAKEHGRQNLIEGELPKNARVVVIEDLVSTGKSSLQAVDALREAGADAARRDSAGRAVPRLARRLGRGLEWILVHALRSAAARRDPDRHRPDSHLVVRRLAARCRRLLRRPWLAAA
jgi:orotate phosphoribosyltransferase